MNPTQTRDRVRSMNVLLRPKKRFEPANSLRGEVARVNLQLPSTCRISRMKKTGHPHPQIWLHPGSTEGTRPLRLPAGSSVHEMMCCFTQASLSPAHFAFLHSYHRRMEGLKAKALETFDRYQPTISIALKRMATLTAAFVSMTAALRAHRWPSFWQ